MKNKNTIIVAIIALLIIGLAAIWIKSSRQPGKLDAFAQCLKELFPICQEKNIESYPTWEFNDGSRLDGEISLTQLAEKTGCPLP